MGKQFKMFELFEAPRDARVRCAASSDPPQKSFDKSMYKEHVLKFLEGELQRWNVQVATGAYTRTPRGSLLN
jgi:hypothetical protein